MSVEVRRPMESADDDVISAMLGIMPFRALFNEEPTNSGRYIPDRRTYAAH
jgi:hypothetical protein